MSEVPLYHNMTRLVCVMVWAGEFISSGRAGGFIFCAKKYSHLGQEGLDLVGGRPAGFEALARLPPVPPDTAQQRSFFIFFFITLESRAELLSSLELSDTKIYEP